MTERTATTATNHQMAIEVIGSDLGGRQFIENSHTLTVHQGGATVLLENKLGPDSEVIVHNLETNEEATARVVGQIRKEGESHVYALAFLDHSTDLWHLQLPSAASPKEIALECSRCRSVCEHSLSEIEWVVFSARRDLTRHCDVCKSSTIWKVTSRKPDEKPQQTTPQKSAPQKGPTSLPSQSRVEERRKSRRTTMRTPACIRCSSQEEMVYCEDISRGGFRFVSRRQYPEGTHVEAAVPYTESGNNIFSRACIVYCSMTPDGRHRHGVAYLKK